MTPTTPTTSTDRRIPTLLLTTLCVLLTLNLVVTVASSSHAAPAEAQPGYGDQPSASPQNAQPGLAGAAFYAAKTSDGIAEINMRLARLEARMDKGFTVKVTEMPAVTISNPVTAPTAPAAKVDANQPKP